MGPKASGKTTLGRDLAKQLGIYHVAFRDYLQEQILAKMKKPPLMDAEDYEKPDEGRDPVEDTGICFSLHMVTVYYNNYLQTLRKKKKMRTILWFLSQKKRRLLKHTLVMMKLLQKKLLRSS